MSVLSRIGSNFTTRPLARPTIIGRRTALALSGDGQFARVANMTGRELIGNKRAAKLLILGASVPVGVGVFKGAEALAEVRGSEDSLFFGTVCFFLLILASHKW